MSTPVLLHPECDPVTVVGGPDYVIYSCLQWQDQNLQVMAQAAKQTFCVMHGDYLDELHVAVLAALGGVLKLTTRNNTLGMTALYGGHRRLTFLMRLVGILIMFILGAITLLL